MKHESIGMFRYGIMIPWERIRFTILHNIYIYYIHNTYKLNMIVIYDYDTHIHIYNHMYILIVLPQILIPEAIVPTLLGWLWLIHCFLQGCHWKGLPLAPSICWIPVISIGMPPRSEDPTPAPGGCTTQIHLADQTSAGGDFDCIGECRKSIANWMPLKEMRWKLHNSFRLAN